MRRFVLISFVSLASICVDAQPRLPQDIHNVVLTGLDLILRQEYRLAESHFLKLSNDQPGHPSGPLYLAATLQARSLDWGTPLEQPRFDSLLTESFKRIAMMKSSTQSAPWTMFFAATAEGYDAVACVEEGNWFAAIQKGISSASQFEDLLEYDSTFADAGVGLGAYLYWRSRKTEFLHWLPFISDDRPRGLRLLAEGAEKGIYNRYAAMSALISISLDAKNYSEAERWSRLASEAYPKNRVFLWGMATALDRAGRCNDARLAYEDLLMSILESGSPVSYDEIVCRLNLAKCLIETGNSPHAKDHLETILTLETKRLPNPLAERAQAKFEETRRLLKQIVSAARTSP